MRVWPPAALLIYVLSVTTLERHAPARRRRHHLPLAVLAVLGVRRTGLARMPRGRARWRRPLCCCGTVPANVYTLSYRPHATPPRPGQRQLHHP